jgi:kumamolisin
LAARVRIHLRILTVLVAAIVAAGVAMTVTARSSAPARSRNGLRLVGAAPANERVPFSLELRLRPGRLRVALEAIEDPRSRAFRHFLSPRAFGATFGISASRMAALVGVIHSAGLQVGSASPQRTELPVEGTVGNVERLLGTRLVVYVDRAGHRYRAPLRPPRIPVSLRGAVDAITGLDTRPHWLPHDVPTGGLTPALTAMAYDIAPLHRAGYFGQGQTIAVISFSAFDPSDPASFARRYRLQGPAPTVAPVQGGTSDLSGQDEADLDVDIIRALAPAARIVVYESYSNYAATIHRIVAAHRANVIASSWGQCERGLDPNERVADSQELSAAVAAGVTMFVATGDNGAYDCQSISPSDHHLTVDWPAASSDAVAVGGTRLDITPSGSYLGETAWEDQLSIQGGGGGFALGDRRPAWQSAPGVISRFSDGRRELPDVSADADPGTPWSYYALGQVQPSGAGTSASAPFWAAAMALIEQYAERHGLHRIGYVNPILYALASSRQPYAPFHDVVTGANRYYQAGPGWDPATGLGSPDVYNLARDIVSYLRSVKGRR